MKRYYYIFENSCNQTNAFPKCALKRKIILTSQRRWCPCIANGIRYGLFNIRWNISIFLQRHHRLLSLYLPTVCARNRGLQWTQKYQTTIFFSLCSNYLSWEFTKNLRPEFICRCVFVFPGTHFFLLWGVRLTLPACVRVIIFCFIRVTILGTLCIYLSLSFPLSLPLSFSYLLGAFLDISGAILQLAFSQDKTKIVLNSSKVY